MASYRIAGGNLSFNDPLRGLLAPFRHEANIAGSLRRAEAAETVLLAALIELQNRFDLRFPAPQPARLVFHRTARTAALRWRHFAARKSGRDFFKLDLESETGREVLMALPTTRRARFLVFESRALVLNAAYAVHRQQRDVLASQLKKLRLLEAVRAHCGSAGR